ncbi:MAG TPA: MerR family transcriptional regulator [Acidimicrobiales bacterium]|nr:MerR family transcriptional regulator [Acidimicrobiales bacterium]
MAERSHLSIGEVLSLLRDEFPDVTISKIRFLESQGLVDPERTPSGYRKFYDHDVERLRWILRQQREHFLPLKVIRGRLVEHGGDDPAEGPLTAEEAAAVPDDAPASGPGAAPSGGGPGEAAGSGTGPGATAAGRRPGPAAPAPTVSPAAPATTAAAAGPAAGPAAAEPVAAARANGPGRMPAPTPSLFAGLHGSPESSPGSGGTAEGAGAAAVAGSARAAPAGRVAAPVPAADENDTYSVEELAAAAGADAAMVQELKQYGLISAHAVVAGTSYFDQGALAVTKAAAEFARHGVEARHLRMWRNAADREADLFQQVVLPLLRQRNPQARRQALETLTELSSAGAALRAALVERAVRDIR